MSVSYLEPLRRAWSRAREMLFTRFTIEKWLVLGFAVFLAGLVDPGLPSAVELRWDLPLRVHGWDEASLFGIPLPELGTVWAIFVAPLLVIALAVGLALLWVGSRGKFIFLDGALNDRARIVEPWHRFKRLGDSLFLWRLGLWLACGVAWAVIVVPAMVVLHWSGEDGPGPWAVLPLFSLVVVGMMLAVVAAFVVLFLDSFIVPIMHASGVGSRAAWAQFLPLLKDHLADFILYGLFVLLLCIAVGLLLLAVTLATCCIVVPLLAVPYVNRVVLLPLSLTYRLYSVEFLAQFGPQYVAAPGAGVDGSVPPA